MKCNLCGFASPRYCDCGGEYEDEEADALRAERDAALARVRETERLPDDWESFAETAHMAEAGALKRCATALRAALDPPA